MKRFFIFLLILIMLVAGGAVALIKFLPTGIIKEFLIQTVEAQTGKSLTVTGDLSLSLFPTLSINAEKIALTEKGDSSKKLASLEELSLSIQVMPLIAARQLLINEVTLKSPEVFYTVDATGKNNWVFTSLTATQENAPSSQTDITASGDKQLSFNIKNIAITNGTIHYDDASSGKNALLKDVNLTSNIAKRDVIPFTFSAFASSNELPAPLPITLKSSIIMADDHIALKDAELILASLKAQLSTDIYYKRPIPYIKANIALNDTNIDAFLALFAAQEEVAAASNENPTPNIATEPAKLDLSALKAVNADITTQLTNVTAFGMVIDSATIATLLTDGMLTNNIKEAQLLDGTLSSITNINNGTTPAFTQELDIKGINLEKLPQDIEALSKLKGKLDFSTQLTAKGDTTDALLASLNGEGNLAILEGRLKGINLLNLIQNIKSAFAFNLSSYTEFQQATASFKAVNGEIHNEDLVLKTTGLTVNGIGHVNLPEHSIKYKLMPAVIVAEADKESVGLRIPVRINGDLSSPLIYPDLAALTPNVGKAAGKVLTDVIKDPRNIKESLKTLKEGVTKDGKNITDGLGIIKDGVGNSLEGVLQGF